MPCDFVVTNAPKMLSIRCGSIPGPESRTATIMTIELSSHPQYPIAIRRSVHCLDRVVDQVKDDLFQLPPMAIDKRQFDASSRRISMP